jgi:signal transduction histidine kinase
MDLLKEELQRRAAGHRQHGWFAALIDARGRTVWASNQDVADTIDPAPVRPLTPYTFRGLRIVEMNINRDDSGIHRIRVGGNLDFLDRDMAHLDRLAYMSAAALLLIAPLSGYWLAGRAARTMGDIIHTAAGLRPSHLDERLMLRGTGDELDQLASTINHLLDRIAAYLQQKRDFLANAAHELRTPLAAIRSSVEVCMTSEDVSEEFSTFLEDLIDQCAALEVLVNQLLLISETETDQWIHAQERVAIHDVAARAVEMFEGVAESRGIQLTLQANCHAEVSGSRHHLRQVINNLIDNAVKYTDPGGAVNVSLDLLPEVHAIRLTVHDNGIGIAEADVPHVFDRFFRADRARTRDPGIQGTGLGLSICQAVVSSHGGTITCRSVVGVGTILEVVLPIAEDPGERPARLTGGASF